MAGNVSFHTLVEALASSVIEAQDRIELYQLSHLRDYFDEDNRPKSVNIRMPSLHPDAEEGDEDLYRAPLLPLIATSNLRIKDVEISFDADLSELGEDEPTDDGSPPAAQDAWDKPRKTGPRIGMDTRAPIKGRSSVHVVLRVEGIEPSDGAARLINQLAQAQGVFKTIKAT